MFIKVEPTSRGYLNSIPCSLVSWFLLSFFLFLFYCIESPSEHLFPCYAAEMNLEGTNNSIILKHKVERTYSPVSPLRRICLLLNLPSLCIIRS